MIKQMSDSSTKGKGHLLRGALSGLQEVFGAATSLAVLMALMLMGMVLMAPALASADVAILNAFPATPQCNAAGTTCTAGTNPTVSAGTSRYVVVVAGCIDGGASTRTFQVQWNGQTLPQVAASTANQRRESSIHALAIGDSGVAQTGALTVTVTAGTCANGTFGYLGSFQGVDQTTPETGATYGFYNNNTVNIFITDCGGGLAVPAGGGLLHGYAGSVAMNSEISGDPYTANYSAVSGGFGAWAWLTSASGLTTEPNLSTGTATYRGGYACMVFQKPACTDSDPTTAFTINPPTSSTTVAGTYNIRATVTGEANPDTGTATITIAGSTACNVTGAPMSWNAGGYWEYNWNTAACGTSVAENPITIDAAYTDPDCGGTTVTNATQITNITIDNTCTDSDAVSSFTINPPVNGATVGGIYNIVATQSGETTNPAGGAATVTIAGSDACNVTDALMTCAADSTCTYAWDTSSCGLVSVDTGITIDAVYTDPDCSGANSANAAQVTSISIDNADPYALAGCAGCHGNPPVDGTRSGATGLFIGSHSTHAGSMGLACTACHVDNGTNKAHRRGTIEMANPINGTAGASYGGGASFPQSNTPTMEACSNTYCHSAGTALTGPFTSTSPSWGGTISDCVSCHTWPPNYASGSPKANSHSVHVTDCSVCHNATTSDGGSTITGPANHGNSTYNVIANSGQFASYTYNAAGGTCNTVCCHGDGSPQWGGTQGCLDCHTGSVCSPNAAALDPAVTTRRPVVGEFGMTWSHKRTALGVVTNNDCGVCHMEGTAADGTKNATYHGNGYVELRDPDTGATIKTVTFSGTPGSYTSTAVDATFVRFSRNLSTNVLESAVTAIQQNQCIKCHDAAGAASALARVPSGTALRPFNTAPTHTPGNNVLNVAAHFATSNSSYHPVLGKQNNSYADADLMWPPFNQTTRTAGSITQWGDLISCWDCHAPDGTASTVTLTSTVTAHGGMTTLRGASTVSGTPAAGNAATLCMLCHDTTTYNQATPGHGPNSAASNLNRTQKVPFLQYGCNVCHASGYNTAATRPTRSEDVHGTNTLPTTGQTLSGRWSTAGTPIAFIRNRSYLGNHEPLKVGATTYSPQCNMVGTDGGTVCTNQGAKTYTVGGTY